MIKYALFCSNQLGEYWGEGDGVLNAESLKKQILKLVSKRSLFGGLSLSFGVACILDIFRFDDIELARVYPSLIVIPLALSAVILVDILIRYIPRSFLFGARFVCVSLILILRIFLETLELGSIFRLSLVFCQFFFLFFLLNPVLSASIRVNVQQMAVGVSTLTILLILLQQFLPASKAGIPNFLSYAFVVIAISVSFVFSEMVAKQDSNNDEEPILVGEKSSRLYIVLFFTLLLAAFATILMIHNNELRIFDLASSGGRFVAPILFIAMIIVHLYLVMNGKIWQSSYITFTSFLVGAMLFWIPAEISNFYYIPLMLLLSALAGVFFLCSLYLLHVTTRFNRPLLFGAALVVLTLLMSMMFFTGFNQMLFDIVPTGPVTVVIMASVLLVSPLLLRDMSQRIRPTIEARVEQQPVLEVVKEPEPVEPEFSAEMLMLNLTNAERKVFELILRQYSNQQIADELYVSINTVKFHIKNILAKSGVQRKNQLFALVYSKTGMPVNTDSESSSSGV
jgi:DNA-binding CsgD family transcriptional regulator